ncbi:MAG TPA: winged helix-turn-helix domain-containing protein [Nocardioidaceae bacterium]|nr:winged helix-turn-helix domain-containing protein [Nocardioidaceae bacterium]
MGLPEEVPQRRPATDAEARALASGLRLQILRLTLDEALTNKEIAERVGRNPASVLHHVRTLVDTGFLRAEPVRRGARGSREVPYRATGKSWLLDGPKDISRAVLAAFLAEAELAPADELETTRLGLRLTEEGLDELRGRLVDLLEEFRARPVDEDAAPWSVFVALHPDAGRR